MRLSVDAFAWPGLLAAALMLPAVMVQCAFPLGESILERSYTAVQLSSLAYETNLTQYQMGNRTWSHPDYDYRRARRPRTRKARRFVYRKRHVIVSSSPARLARSFFAFISLNDHTRPPKNDGP